LTSVCVKYLQKFSQRDLKPKKCTKTNEIENVGIKSSKETLSKKNIDPDFNIFEYLPFSHILFHIINKINCGDYVGWKVFMFLWIPFFSF
jgi:hypothetical protein